MIPGSGSPPGNDSRIWVPSGEMIPHLGPLRGNDPTSGSPPGNHYSLNSDESQLVGAVAGYEVVGLHLAKWRRFDFAALDGILTPGVKITTARWVGGIRDFTAQHYARRPVRRLAAAEVRIRFRHRRQQRFAV